MLTMFFGEHKEPCSDCTQIGGKLVCTMNCGPCVKVPRGEPSAQQRSKNAVESDRTSKRSTRTI